jgi:hypothetical protein
VKLSGHNWIGPQADRDCAESLRLSGSGRTKDFIVFLFLAAGPERLEPFRTAGGEAAILT